MQVHFISVSEISVHSAFESHVKNSSLEHSDLVVSSALTRPMYRPLIRNNTLKCVRVLQLTSVRACVSFIASVLSHPIASSEHKCSDHVWRLLFNNYKSKIHECLVKKCKNNVLAT